MIGISIVNYNSSEFTLACLESLRKVTTPDFSIYCVDNASTDDSAARIGQWTTQAAPLQARLIKADANSGFAAGNNLALKQMLKDGIEHVLLLNNDTLVEPDFLAPLLSCACEKKNSICTGMIYNTADRNKIEYAGGHINQWACCPIHHKRPPASRQPQVTRFISGCFLFLPLVFFNRFGLMDESFFMYMEDLELNLRLIKNGYTLWLVPASRIYHAVGASVDTMALDLIYYSFRNRMAVVRNYYSLQEKILFTAWLTLNCAWRLLHSPKTLNPVFRGVFDFLKGRQGKKGI
jgi:GT2 family glycosyltransferase